MPAIISPVTLESFAENRIKTLLEAQLTKIPDANILTGHTIDDEGLDQEAPVIVVTVTRDQEEIPGEGWWVCSVEIELDPRDLTDEDIDDISLSIETAIGDGDSSNKIEAQLTDGRLKCLTNSVFFDQGFEYNPNDDEKLRYFKFTASLGLLAP